MVDLATFAEQNKLKHQNDHHFWSCLHIFAFMSLIIHYCSLFLSHLWQHRHSQSERSSWPSGDPRLILRASHWPGLQKVDFHSQTRGFFASTMCALTLWGSLRNLRTHVKTLEDHIIMRSVHFTDLWIYKMINMINMPFSVTCLLQWPVHVAVTWWGGLRWSQDLCLACALLASLRACHEWCHCCQGRTLAGADTKTRQKSTSCSWVRWFQNTMNNRRSLGITNDVCYVWTPDESDDGLQSMMYVYWSHSWSEGLVACTSTPWLWPTWLLHATLPVLQIELLKHKSMASSWRTRDNTSRCFKYDHRIEICFAEFDRCAMANQKTSLPLCLRVHWWCVKALLGAFPCLSQVFHPTKIKQDSSNVWERSIALIILICRYLQIFANMLSKLSMLSILSMLSSSNFPFCRNVAVFTSFYPLKSLGSSMACSVHCSASFSIHKIHKSWGTCFSRADRCWGQGWGGVVEDARWTLEEVGRNGPVSSQGRQGQDFLQHPSVFHETNIRREPHNIKIIKIFVHFKAWIMSCICIWKLCISLFYFGHTKLTKHADICSIETSPAISVAGGLAVPCEWRARELHRALFDRGLGGPWGTWRMFVDDLGWFLLSKRFGFNMWRHCEDHLVDICRSYSILIMYNLRHQDAIWCNKF